MHRHEQSRRPWQLYQSLTPRVAHAVAVGDLHLFVEDGDEVVGPCWRAVATLTTCPQRPRDGCTCDRHRMLQ